MTVRASSSTGTAPKGSLLDETTAREGLSRKEFDRFRRIVYDRSGIALSESKESLVQGRIGKRMRHHGFTKYLDYLNLLEADESGEETVLFLDAIATNVTHFFREREHFDFLAARIAEWEREGRTQLRLWSAACSTGEEPYTIGITVFESLRDARLDVRILGTDLSTKVLRASKEGRYREERLADVPAALRDRYFDRDRAAGCYVAGDRLRRLMTFCRLNLAEPPYPMKGPFDAVFCRNVMIYFDNIVRRRLLEEISRLLRPGGYLFVGHAESLTGRLTDLTTIRPSIYRKPM